LVRQLRPDLPIIYGGWHPSLLPAETLREDFVDIVVMHQGERTLVEILQRLEKRAGLHPGPGGWFKQKGKIVSKSHSPTTPISHPPIPPTTWSISKNTQAQPAGVSCHTPRAPGVPTPATTAPTWCSTTGGSIRWNRCE